jgi:hypothetical protein
MDQDNASFAQFQIALLVRRLLNAQFAIKRQTFT